MVKKTLRPVRASTARNAYLDSDSFIDDVIDHPGKNVKLEPAMYNVESIVDKKRQGTKILYLVKWEGYSSD